ncbi:fatty acyl-CoA synthetase [Sphingobium boeckii]|uniref:3-methylmercaptopropionyl-CoA ligase n=1 Tax=Sphingobium boeckii TaxID=1082345 RepID=A0A7W9AHB9_9SPHN|nr:fatty acyl-CoA synthetase [Sphingobium boeckii]MBB5685690.1 fatty-acyl-CoA synthase [Sphingobium boeckii]
MNDTIGAALHRAARKFRDRTAISFGDRSWSFRDLDRAAGNVARGLLATGLQKGDRVAVFGANSDAYLLCWLGCARAGLVHVPINNKLSSGELAYIVGQSGSRAMFCDADRLAEVAALPDLPSLSIFGTLAADAGLDVLRLAGQGDGSPPDVAVEGHDLAQIQYTSGTTSAPKGAMMTHAAILAEYMSCIHDLEYAEGDACLAALPLYHTAQMHAFSMPQLLAGGTIWILDRPDPMLVFERVRRHRIVSFFAPPTVWISLLRHPAFDDHDLTSLTKLYYGASIMPRPVLDEIARRLPNGGLFNVYGQSEIGPVATVLKPGEHAARPTSAGRPVLNVETRIVDEQMNEVPAGARGEIVHRSPQLLAGYWQRDDETEAAFKGGWFHSGDVGIMDEQGYLHIVDRVRDVINTGGVLVASREVEDVLFTHPAVSEVSVIGLPDDKWIEGVTAVVILRADAAASEGELIDHARRSLAAYKVPKRVYFVDDLPRNAAGKILKRELREHFGATRDPSNDRGLSIIPNVQELSGDHTS